MESWKNKAILKKIHRSTTILSLCGVKLKKLKKQMLIKPREIYLQGKSQKMNPIKNLMSSFQKDLGDKVKTIIKEENVLITEVSKDLKNSKNLSQKSNMIFNRVICLNKK